MRIREFTEKIRSGEISVVEHTQKILKEIKESNQKFHHFNIVTEKLALKQAEELEKKIKKENFNGKLLGVPLSVKDSIIVGSVENLAGSRILENYKPGFSATAVEKAVAEGAIIVGKTSQDEFGFGAFSTNTGIGFKAPKNPHNLERVAGGSSGGSAGFTALTKFSHASLGESTGGSIVVPAAFCGIVGFCPTYGRVSRYGLIDYSSSNDKIGPMAKTVEDAALVLEVIAGLDERDGTSLPEKVPEYSSFVGKNPNKLRVGVIKEFFADGIDKEVSEIVWNAVKKLEGLGVECQEISLPLSSKYGVYCYYLLAMTEASTNLARYCGMRYGKEEDLKGNFNEYFSMVRGKNFGAEAKRRILLGTFARMAGFREAYYLKGLKVRTKLIEEFKKSLKKFDVLVSPTTPYIAPKFSEIEKLTPVQTFLADSCTAAPNVCGFPQLTLKVGQSKKMPVGIMFLADHLQEEKLIQVGSALEVALNE